jgi:hypothetical protein
VILVPVQIHKGLDSQADPRIVAEMAERRAAAELASADRRMT